MPYPSLALSDISTFRKYVKNIGRAYQKRSVAMISLCLLFLEISSGKPDQTESLKGSTTRLLLRPFYLLISPLQCPRNCCGCTQVCT